MKNEINSRPTKLERITMFPEPVEIVTTPHGSASLDQVYFMHKEKDKDGDVIARVYNSRGKITWSSDGSEVSIYGPESVEIRGYKTNPLIVCKNHLRIPDFDVFEADTGKKVGAFCEEFKPVRISKWASFPSEEDILGKSEQYIFTHRISKKITDKNSWEEEHECLLNTNDVLISHESRLGDIIFEGDLVVEREQPLTPGIERYETRFPYKERPLEDKVGLFRVAQIINNSFKLHEDLHADYIEMFPDSNGLENRKIKEIGVKGRHVLLQEDNSTEQFILRSKYGIEALTSSIMIRPCYYYPKKPTYYLDSTGTQLFGVPHGIFGRKF